MSQKYYNDIEYNSLAKGDDNKDVNNYDEYITTNNIIDGAKVRQEDNNVVRMATQL